MEIVVPPGDEPSFGKWIDLQMLVMAGGRERTAPEYEQLFLAAGFTLDAFSRRRWARASSRLFLREPRGPGDRQPPDNANNSCCTPPGQPVLSITPLDDTSIEPPGI